MIHTQSAGLNIPPGSAHNHNYHHCVRHTLKACAPSHTYTHNGSKTFLTQANTPSNLQHMHKWRTKKRKNESQRIYARGASAHTHTHMSHIQHTNVEKKRIGIIIIRRRRSSRNETDENEKLTRSEFLVVQSRNSKVYVWKVKNLFGVVFFCYWFILHFTAEKSISFRFRLNGRLRIEDFLGFFSWIGKTNWSILDFMWF